MFGSGVSSIMKFNRNQIAKRKTFETISENYHEKHVVMKDVKLTPAQLERFKIELQEKRRREMLKKALVLFVISFSVITIFILVLR